MAFNFIQFQHGMSPPEFFKHFGTEDQCAQAVKSAGWPCGFRCPRCNAAEHYVVGHGARKLFQCLGCRYQTSLTVGSLFEHTKLPLRTWFLAICLLSQAKIGLSSLALKRQLGVSYPTASALQHKINHAMAQREGQHKRSFAAAGRRIGSPGRQGHWNQSHGAYSFKRVSRARLAVFELRQFRAANRRTLARPAGPDQFPTFLVPRRGGRLAWASCIGRSGS